MYQTDDAEEQARVAALQEQAGKNPNIYQEPTGVYLSLMSVILQVCGFQPTAWNDGRVLTEADTHEFLILNQKKLVPLLVQARDQYPTKGARWEFYDCFCKIMLVSAGQYPICHNTRENVMIVEALTSAHWGEDSTSMLESMRTQSFKRHHLIGTTSMWTNK